MAKGAKSGGSRAAAKSDSGDRGGQKRVAKARKPGGAATTTASGTSSRDTASGRARATGSGTLQHEKPAMPASGKSASVSSSGRKDTGRKSQTRRKPATITPVATGAEGIDPKDALIADLQRELDAARAHIADLERRHDVAVNRIDWILDTLKTASEPVKRRKPKISRRSRG
jgi:hypothetical protein